MSEKTLGADAAAVGNTEPVASDPAIARHTPAPWRVIDRGNTGGSDFGIESANPDHHSWIVADVWGDVAELEREAQANAHLIAAAPEMLEALKAIVDFVDGDASPEIQICGRHYDAARRAIAKAEGRS